MSRLKPDFSEEEALLKECTDCGAPEGKWCHVIGTDTPTLYLHGGRLGVS